MREGATGHLIVVQVCVQHDHRVRQDIDGISVMEDLGALLVVQAAKGLHDPVDLLSFAW